MAVAVPVPVLLCRSELVLGVLEGVEVDCEWDFALEDDEEELEPALLDGSSRSPARSEREVEWERRDGVWENAGSDRRVLRASGDCDMLTMSQESRLAVVFVVWMNRSKQAKLSVWLRCVFDFQTRVRPGPPPRRK